MKPPQIGLESTIFTQGGVLAQNAFFKSGKFCSFFSTNLRASPHIPIKSFTHKNQSLDQTVTQISTIVTVKSVKKYLNYLNSMLHINETKNELNQSIDHNKLKPNNDVRSPNTQMQIKYGVKKRKKKHRFYYYNYIFFPPANDA